LKPFGGLQSSIRFALPGKKPGRNSLTGNENRIIRKHNVSRHGCFLPTGVLQSSLQRATVVVTDGGTASQAD
jgi:hypothetical protein